ALPASATSYIYTLSLHDALPIYGVVLEFEGGIEKLIAFLDEDIEKICRPGRGPNVAQPVAKRRPDLPHRQTGEQIRSSLGDRLRSEEHTSELQSPYDLVCRLLLE